MGDALAVVPGLAIVPGHDGKRWIRTKRPISQTGSCIRDHPSNVGGTRYALSKLEQTLGTICACYAQVYLDHTLMIAGMPAEPFDVNSKPVSQIEAIEFYEGPSQTPAKYSPLNSGCGVYVIHARRS
ncbi:MAG: hypothetical protein KA154_01120 [Gemmatimonadaceae bacterium]|nr:hypothetical protein [Gemmatimonadaceae bacterium]